MREEDDGGINVKIDMTSKYSIPGYNREAEEANTALCVTETLRVTLMNAGVVLNVSMSLRV